jgi:hypothetical protein
MLAIVGAIAVPALQTVLRPITLASYRPLVEPLIADLQALELGPADTVQVFDTIDGGMHALFRSGSASGSRPALVSLLERDHTVAADVDIPRAGSGYVLYELHDRTR